MTVTDEPYDPTFLDAADRLTRRRPPAPAPDPPAPVDRELIPTSKVIQDRVLDALGLIQHPTPNELAGGARDVAKLLETNGTRAIRLAALYAARGWPAATSGGGQIGGSGSSDDTSTERAVLHGLPDTDVAATLRPGDFDDIDRRLAKALRLLDLLGLHITALVTELVAHGDDVDELPPGVGGCQACGRFCDPRRNPNDRLRSGFCDACRKQWDRDGRPQRSTWAHLRRHAVNHGRPGMCTLCEQPWTPEPVSGVA